MTHEDITKQIEEIETLADSADKRQLIQASIAKALWEIALQLSLHRNN